MPKLDLITIQTIACVQPPTFSTLASGDIESSVDFTAIHWLLSPPRDKLLTTMLRNGQQTIKTV